ncbi:MAG: hypothetical protein HQM12_09095 [SAR324 cluster bacterium]|nr:hypothetical protein [SAR324 cluster bacterium]MBF0349933.1 hypothetical protein [SAR324 cluster bacterium]
MEDLLFSYKTGINKVFGVCVQILNISRSFDKLAFEMELLAKNGIIKATRIRGNEGKPLISLAGELSKLPQQIQPEITELESKCVLLSRKIALCSVAARRYYQYTQSLIRFKATQNRHDQVQSLIQNLHKPTYVKNFISTLSHDEITPIDYNNFQYLIYKSEDNLKETSALLFDALDIVSASLIQIDRIKKIQQTTQYMAICISVNAAHLQSDLQEFNSLIENIGQVVKNLDNRLLVLQEHVEHGERLLHKLAHRKSLI